MRYFLIKRFKYETLRSILNVPLGEEKLIFFDK